MIPSNRNQITDKLSHLGNQTLKFLWNAPTILHNHFVDWLLILHTCILIYHSICFSSFLKLYTKICWQSFVFDSKCQTDNLDWKSTNQPHVSKLAWNNRKWSIHCLKTTEIKEFVWPACSSIRLLTVSTEEWILFFSLILTMIEHFR